MTPYVALGLALVVFALGWGQAEFRARHYKKLSGDMLSEFEDRQHEAALAKAIIDDANARTGRERSV